MKMTLLERVKCMLSNSRLNRGFWAEAINRTCYLMNCSPSNATDFRTPTEVWSNKPIEYSMLKVFRCLTYYHVSEDKLKPKAKKDAFYGIWRWTRSIQSLISIRKKVILSRDAFFMNSLCCILNLKNIWARLRKSLSM